MRNYYIALSILGFIVLLVLALGVYTLNFSQPEQDQVLDEQRRSGMLALEQQIEEFWFRSGRLPDSLFEMRLVGDYRDPVTGKTYDYIKSDPQHYSICGVFSLPSPSNAAFFHPQGYESGA